MDTRNNRMVAAGIGTLVLTFTLGVVGLLIGMVAFAVAYRSNP